MTKQLQFDARARYSIKKGVDTLANAVRVTIGPRGRNVVLDHPLDAPSIIKVEEGRGLTSEIEYIKGMQFDRGYISPYMATNQERMEAVLSNPYILVTDKKITTIPDLLPLLERLLAAGRKELMVIAEDIEGEALTSLVVNKTRGVFNVLAVRAPSFGERREAVMEDIAILTGGKVISEKTGTRLQNATISDLGTARSVTTTKDSTLIVDGGGSQEAIQARIRELRAQLANGDSDFDREKLQQRLANLSAVVAVI